MTLRLRRLALPALALGLLAGTPAPASGQAALLVLLFGDKVASDNFYFSLKVGGNFSKLSGLDDTKFAAGLNFGLLATIRLNDQWYIEPEFAPLSKKGSRDIAYVPSGSSELDALLDPPDDARINLNYIDVPVLVKYQASERLRVGTGPQIGYLTSGTNQYDRTYERTGGEDDLRYQQGSQTQFNSWDFGWAFEAAATLWDARDGEGLVIHTRYVLGLSDVIENNPGDAITNSTVQIFASFPFIKSGDDEDGS